MKKLKLGHSLKLSIYGSLKTQICSHNMWFARPPLSTLRDYLTHMTDVPWDFTQGSFNE